MARTVMSSSSHFSSENAGQRRRRPVPCSVGAALLLLVACTGPGGVRAQSAPIDCSDGERCWSLAFLSLGKTTALGLRSEVSHASVPGNRQSDVGLTTSYSAERYATRDALSVYSMVHGEIGGGTGGTHGGLEGALSIGARYAMTPQQGPIGRLGPSLLLFGHGSHEMRMFTPIRATLAFQRHEKERLLELGVHGGIPAASRVRILGDVGRLGGSLALSPYLVVRLDGLRFASSVTLLRPWLLETVPASVMRAELCAYPWDLAVCVNAELVQAQFGDVRTDAGFSVARAGLTLGLTP